MRQSSWQKRKPILPASSWTIFSLEELDYPLMIWIQFAPEFRENWDGVALIYGWFLYDDELNRSSYDSYLERFDYITFWTKDSDNLSKLPKNLATLEAKISRFTKNSPKIALGCYMWDYQNVTNRHRQPREMPLEKMSSQLATALEWLKNGRISDVIILGSNIVDASRASDAVAETKKWIRDHGSEVLP